MRNSLIALATVGLLASGGAVAGTPTIQHDLVPVQYANQYAYPNQYANREPYVYRSDDRAANINEREARIKPRIDRGVNDGRLTNWEARRLYRELAAIEAKERAFMADGRLSYREDAELNSNLNQLSDNVRAQLRDDERRYSYYSR